MTRTLTSMTALALGAAIAAPANAQDSTIAFSALSLDIPAMQGLSAKLEGKAGEAGVGYMVLDPKFDPATQAQQLMALIESGRIDGAWAIVIAEPPMRQAVDAAIANEVALVVSGRPEAYGLDGPQPGIAFSEINFEEHGLGLGTQMAACLNENQNGGGKVFEFIEQSAWGEAVREFAFATISDQITGEVDVVNQSNVTDPVAAQQAILQSLQANPDLAGVYALNDEQTLGAVTAFESAGLDIPCIVTGGGGDETVNFIEQGKVYASVGFDFAGDAQQNFDTVLSMMEDPTADGPILNIPLMLIQ